MSLKPFASLHQPAELLEHKEPLTVDATDLVDERPLSDAELAGRSARLEGLFTLNCPNFFQHSMLFFSVQLMALHPCKVPLP